MAKLIVVILAILMPVGGINIAGKVLTKKKEEHLSRKDAGISKVKSELL